MNWPPPMSCDDKPSPVAAGLAGPIRAVTTLARMLSLSPGGRVPSKSPEPHEPVSYYSRISPWRRSQRNELKHLTAQTRLTRALVGAVPRDAARAKQIDTMLADEPWNRSRVSPAIARRVVRWISCRGKSPPCRANLARLDKPFGDPSGKRESAELLDACSMPVCRGSNPIRLWRLLRPRRSVGLRSDNAEIGKAPQRERAVRP